MPISMSLSRIAVAAVAGGTLLATAVFAAGHGGNPAVKARQAHMQVYAFNLTILGNMARGNTEYDAEAASAAASNLAALTAIDQSAYWEPGTDSDSVAESNALPALWDNIPDVIEKANTTSAAAAALAVTAGDGLDALRAGIGPLGAACGDCHESYQKPEG